MTDSKFWRTCPSCQRLLQAKLFKHSPTCIDCSLGNSAHKEAVVHLPPATPGVESLFSQRVLKQLQLKRDQVRTDLQTPDLHWRLADLYLICSGTVLCSPTEQSITYPGVKVIEAGGQLQIVAGDISEDKLLALEQIVNKLNSLYWNSIKVRATTTLTL